MNIIKRVHRFLFAKRKYEGASKRHRIKNWFTSANSVNTENKGSLQILRDRARDLNRNNPYARRGTLAVASNTVGCGIIPKTKNREVQLAWESWGASLNVDFDGRYNFYGLQNLVMETLVMSGECLILRKRVAPTPENPLPIQIQVIEPDFLDDSRDHIGQANTDGGFIQQGIEFDKRGKRVAYWLFDEHPGEQHVVNKFFSNRVPVEDIIHVYRTDRPGQIRGVSWFAPIMIRLRDLDEYEDAQLVRQKIAACFAGFIRDIEVPEEAEDGDEILDKIQPGTFTFLDSNKDITFSNPPSVENYQEYLSVNLRAIGMGLAGVPYYILTGDLQEANFSNTRAGLIQFNINIDGWQKNHVVNQTSIPVWRWFTDALELIGVNTLDSKAKWTAPKRAMVNPIQDRKAMTDAVRSGFMTQSQAIMENGHDPDEFLKEYKADLDKLDDLKIVLDTDPRKIGGGGTAQNESTVIAEPDIAESEDREFEKSVYGENY